MNIIWNEAVAANFKESSMKALPWRDMGNRHEI
jgi:hypothetical protein